MYIRDQLKIILPYWLNQGLINTEINSSNKAEFKNQLINFDGFLIEALSRGNPGKIYAILNYWVDSTAKSDSTEHNKKIP